MSASSSPLIQQSSDRGVAASHGRGLTLPPVMGPVTRHIKPVQWLVGGVVIALAVGAGAYGLGRYQASHVSADASAVPQEMSPAEAGAGRTAHRAASPSTGGEAPAAPTTAAVSCAQCGIVESVQAVQRKGEGSGVGAVAGGVLGGALGNQMGAGSGRTAMTVIGAIGGGLAGNEVEKRARAVTVYRVTVRMDGGETRTIEQSQAPGVGQRVKVEGRHLKSI